MMQVLAGMFLSVGVILCVASSFQDDLQLRCGMVFWGLVIYSAGFGCSWVNHLICEHDFLEDEEEESSANTP